MQPRQYVDLDLTIEADGAEYVARVVDSPAGQATHRFALPFNNVGLENFILKLGHNRGVTRRAHSPRLTTAREFGDALYRAVFDGEVEISFRRSLDQALASERGLRIRLRIEGAPALAEIPWEYLYAEGLGRFVVMSSDTPLVRYLDLPKGAAPLTVEPPLRVLVMVSSPSDLDPLDVEREVELLRQATADLTAAGVLELEIVPHARLRTLQHQLRVAEYHVFHFIGHGVYDEKEDDGLLMLEDDEGRSRGVSGLDLGVLLHDHHSLRLAVLNACEGARGSVENPLGGVAQSLIRQGLPAAVAMQFEISDEAALVFAHEFYLAIGDGYPIDAATVEARKAIFASGNDVEWGTPVLHLRATDARVFDLRRAAPTETRPSQEREAATQALADRRFADAVAGWEAILAGAPGDEAAVVMLKRARDGVEAERLYGSGAALIAEGKASEAMATLDQVLELDAEHDDPDRLRERAETLLAAAAETERRIATERRLAAVDEELGRAEAAIDAGDLGDARRRLVTVLEVAPDHAAALTLQEVVRRRLRASEAMEQAGRAADANRWDDVMALVEEARRLDPDVEDDQGLAAEASWELARHTTAEAPPPAAATRPAPVEPQARPPRLARNWVAIGAGIAAVVLVMVVVALIRDGEGPVDSTLTSVTSTTTGSTIQIPVGDVGIVPIAGLTIDGDASDWPEGSVTQSNHSVHPSPGASPGVTANWFVGYDSASLYVVAQVSDPSIDRAPIGDPDQLFVGDSVHFEFGADPSGAGSLREGDLHLMLAPVDPSSSDVLAAINPARDGAFRAGSVQPDVTAAVVWLQGGYRIEAAIPWSVLGVGGPNPGLVLGMNFNVSDGDGSGRLQEMVSSNADRTGANQPRPGTWNSAVLLDR
jgi:tetratricopeptide (TPR) repeat protein